MTRSVRTVAESSISRTQRATLVEHVETRNTRLAVAALSLFHWRRRRMPGRELLIAIARRIQAMLTRRTECDERSRIRCRVDRKLRKRLAPDHGSPASPPVSLPVLAPYCAIGDSGEVVRHVQFCTRASPACMSFLIGKQSLKKARVE